MRGALWLAVLCLWTLIFAVACPENVPAQTPASDVTKASSPYAELNLEEIYYAQQPLLRRATATLLRQRPGITDLYFVGFAGYAYEDVFLREVQASKKLFDDRFDTSGRSVALANSLQTFDSLPLANGHNLHALLQHIGDVIDPEEDMVFLFLTSHGAAERLAVEFGPLGLNDLGATALKPMLDDAGIKWRVVVVSACYSGGFIDPLKTDYSLIITSSREDRASFGCSSDHEMTYFGKAFFDEQLRHSHSYLKAFENAAAAIATREQEQRLPRSQPQIYVGPAMRARLQELETRRDGLASVGATKGHPGQKHATSMRENCEPSEASGVAANHCKR